MAPNTEPTATPNDEPIVDPPDDGEAVDIDDDGNATAAPPVVAAPPASEEDVEFGRLTPREKALVEKARAQEKTKLYGQLTDMKERLRQLQTPPQTTSRSAQPPTTRSAREAEIAQLQTSVSQLSEQIRRRDLREYRKDKVADLRARNVGFIESLIAGESEDVIDASIQLAIAEHGLQETEFKTKYKIGDNGTTTPNAAPTSVVIRQSAPRRPEGVPSVVGAGVGGDSSDVLSKAQINAMTSWDAIRNGTFAANRDRIHEAVRTGKVRD